MRDRLKIMLTTSLKAGEKRRVATVRLILAAIKDRDIATRTEGQGAGVSDEEILSILQKMVKQRRESTVLYQEGGRLELAAQEEEEILIIEEFLPQQIGDDELAAAVCRTPSTSDQWLLMKTRWSTSIGSSSTVNSPPPPAPAPPLPRLRRRSWTLRCAGDIRTAR